LPALGNAKENRMTRADRSKINQKAKGAKAAASAAALGAMLAGSAEAGDLALKRAVLSAGGVGYFEYEAEVDGGQSSLSLRARLDQVDDILKSMIVLDEAGAASVSLPGKAGADQAFASLPFSQDDLGSLPALIGALKGARLSIEGPRKLSGTILSATPETTRDKDDAERTVTRVALLSGLSVEQFVLEDAQGLAFEDRRLGQQVETALAALRAAKDKSGRDVSINLAPGGKRRVRVGYVAEAPVWKAAYRLSLPQGEGKARLQGWAVLENMTGADWDGVALTLTSGAPVTFRQALYDPYYVARRTVPPPVPRLALPRQDEGQMPIAVAGAVSGAGAMSPVLARTRQSQGVDKRMMAAPAPMAKLEESDAVAMEPAPFGASAAGASEAVDGALGAAFSLTAPVKAKAGESLSLPFLDVETAAGDSVWAQSGVTMKNPWRAVRLANSGVTAWPAGSVTLYEPSAAGPLFVGEAQLPTTPGGQERLLAFGADAKVTVDREASRQDVAVDIWLAGGTLHVTRTQRLTTLYRIKNDDVRPREVVVDHPRSDGATLVSPKLEDAVISGRDWRMKRALAPGQTQAFEIVTERPMGETVAVSDATREAVLRLVFPGRTFETTTKDAFAAALSETKLSPQTIERLQKLGDAAEAVASENAKIEALDEERAGIVSDQERIRENLKTVGLTGDFGKSLVAKLRDQEARLVAISSEKAKAAAARDAARNALNALVIERRANLDCSSPIGCAPLPNPVKYDVRQFFRFNGETAF
jgi:hypothetical protein